MTRFPRLTAVIATLSMLSPQIVSASGILHRRQPGPQQTTGPVQNTPVPPEVLSGHRVFLSNAGAAPNFPGTAEEAYNTVAAALKAWGHYELVESPEQADLLFKLREISPVTGVGGGDDTPSYAITSPTFELTIADAHSGAHLWTVTSPVNLSYKKRERERWYNLSVTNLISRLKVLNGQSLSATETADLTTVPPRDHRLLFVAVGATAASLGTFLIVKHVQDTNYRNETAALCAQSPLGCPTGAVLH